VGGLQQEVDKVFQFWDTEEGDSLHAGQCMQELLEQVRRHKVNIDGDVCTVMVTTLVLEASLFIQTTRCFHVRQAYN